MSIANARSTLTRIKLELNNPGLTPERLLGFVDKIERELPTPEDDEFTLRTRAGIPVSTAQLGGLPVCDVRFRGHLAVIEGGKV